MRLILAILLVVQTAAVRLGCGAQAPCADGERACVVEAPAEGCCCAHCADADGTEPFLCILCRACEVSLPGPLPVAPNAPIRIPAGIPTPPTVVPVLASAAGEASAWLPNETGIIHARSARAERLRPVVCVWTI